MPKKTLIIDTSIQSHQAYKKMLSRYDCEVIAALDGEAGLYQLMRNPGVNLLIIDMNLPHMSGMEFIKRVQRFETKHHIPIIAIISDDGHCSTGEVSKHGVLMKPFTSKEFHSVITKSFLLDQSTNVPDYRSLNAA